MHFFRYLIGIIFLGHCPLHAQEILALDTGGHLYSVDPSSGVATYIGATGIHTYEWTGLAQNSRGELFAASGDWIANFSIYQLDPATGQATFASLTGLSGISCMAFDSNDKLFVGHDPAWPGGGGIFELYEVDLASGAESLVGSTGIVNLLALDHSNGQLFGHNSFEGLLTIDASTGMATDVNPFFIGPLGATMSMCFNDQGALFYLDHALWVQDSGSGIRAPIDWVSKFDFWGEAVFVEGPKPNFTLWLDGTADHYMGVKMTGVTPNGQVAVLWAKGEGGPTLIPNGYPCAGTLMDLNPNMQLLSTTTADGTGHATLGPSPSRIPAAAAGLIWLQAVDVSTCQTSNKALLYF
jgi:hypothetical protein